jgi:hypothetical protein
MEQASPDSGDRSTTLRDRPVRYGAFARGTDTPSGPALSQVLRPPLRARLEPVMGLRDVAAR